MKKLIIPIFIIISILALSSCSSISSFEGEWKAVSVDTAGHSLSASEQAMIGEMLDNYVISVNNDGTATFSRKDKENVMKATWYADENKITFKTDEENDIEGILENSRLVLNMDSEGKLIFEKQ